MYFAWRTLTLLSLATIYGTGALELASNYLTACAGSSINGHVTKCPTDSIIRLVSITIYASTEADAIGGDTTCLQASQCKRIIHTAADFGLSQSYVHLYKWFRNKCEGKSICDEGQLPEWWAVTGETKDSAGATRVCPESGPKYFTAILAHLSCVVGEEVAEVPPPPSTTPITKPTTPTSTTAFPVFIPIYQPVMQDIEKVILGIAIGLSIAILIVLLLVLYCCERYRKSKNMTKLLKMLGAPQAQDAYDEDYSKTETWTDGVINEDALGEYTGVKPDEFLTMSKQDMMSSGQLMYDTGIGGMGTARRNSCSTLSRHGGIDRYPSIENGANGYTGPMVYDTEENMELERRMAAVLNEAGEGENNSTEDSAIGTDEHNERSL